jgi:hypothetical protein
VRSSGKSTLCLLVLQVCFVQRTLLYQATWQEPANGCASCRPQAVLERFEKTEYAVDGKGVVEYLRAFETTDAIAGWKVMVLEISVLKLY